MINTRSQIVSKMRGGTLIIKKKKKSADFLATKYYFSLCFILLKSEQNWKITLIDDCLHFN